MDRVRDYSAFAIGYCGFGYVLLWPFISPYASGELFGAAFVCGEGAVMPLRWLCGLPHPLHISVPLHLLGLFSAVIALACLALRALARLRQRPAAAALDAGAPAGHPPATSAVPSRLRPLRPLRPVKPRTHFGLRGTPH